MDIHKDCYSAIDLTRQDGPHRRETDILQMTKDKCIERQEKTNCGIGLRMATKADRSIMIWA